MRGGGLACSIIATSYGSGGVSAINAYDEYGIPAPTNSGRFGYTGQTWLPELKLWYYKARMYSPTLGRFLQTDPIGYGDGMNMYNYVGGDPVNFVDPTGLCVQVGDLPPYICKTPGVVTNCQKKSCDHFGGNEGGYEPAGPRYGYGAYQGASAYVRPAKPKDDPGCVQAMQEPGKVRVGSVNYTAIVGGGITGSSGVFRNVKTGTTGKYFTLGGGAGVDVGVSATVGTYRSAGDLSGGSVNVSGTFAIFTAAASFSAKNLDYIGSVIGFAPPSKALSVTLTGTRLYGCRVGG